MKNGWSASAFQGRTRGTGHFSSPPERRWLEAQRELFDHYEDKGFFLCTPHLGDVSTRRGFVSKMARLVDDRLRRSEALGRAVDFKGALPVLVAYAEYRAWVESLELNTSRHTTVLNVSIPYNLHVSGVNAHGPGFFRLCIMLSDPKLRKLNELSWEVGQIEMAELELNESLTPIRHAERFWADPFSFATEYNRHYSIKSSHRGVSRPQSGFVGKHSADWRGFVNEGPSAARIFTPKRHCVQEVMDHRVRLIMANPTAAQMQKFLDNVATLLTRHYMPHRFVQLHFDVAPGLTEIMAGSVLLPPHTPRLGEGKRYFPRTCTLDELPWPEETSD